MSIIKKFAPKSSTKEDPITYSKELQGYTGFGPVGTTGHSGTYGIPSNTKYIVPDVSDKYAVDSDPPRDEDDVISDIKSLDTPKFIANAKKRGMVLRKFEKIGRVKSLLASKAANYASDSSMKMAAENKYYCFFSESSSATHSVRMFMGYDYLTNAYAFAKADIEELPEEFQSLDYVLGKVKEQFDGIFAATLEKFTKEFEPYKAQLEPNNKPLEEINFCTDDSFDTEVQLMQIVCDAEGNKLIRYNFIHDAKIHDVIVAEQESGDYLLYIPKQWTDAVGYKEQDVIRWIQLINEMGLDVGVYYLGIGERDSFKAYPLSDFRNFNPHLRLSEQIDIQRLMWKNEFHLIKMDACEFGLFNYFIYTLIIGLYHTSYKTIPGITMQIKSQLPELSAWQAFLLACIGDYKGAYIDERFGGGSISRIVNPFDKDNDINSIVNRMSKSTLRFTQGVKYLSVGHEKLTQYCKLMNDKRFVELYNEVKSLKTK